VTGRSQVDAELGLERGGDTFAVWTGHTFAVWTGGSFAVAVECRRGAVRCRDERLGTLPVAAGARGRVVPGAGPGGEIELVFGLGLEAVEDVTERSGVPGQVLGAL